jgi:hypothetical protein
LHKIHCRNQPLLVLCLLMAACDGSEPPIGGDDAGAGDTGTAPSPAAAIEILRRPPFPPRDPALFLRALYPDTPEESTAPGPGLNAAQARALLSETLARRGLPAADVTATVALFDDPVLGRTIPAPALRAALLLLRGTAGDAAIATLTAAGGPFSGVGVGPLPAFAAGSPAIIEGRGARGQIVFADWTAGEDPRALAAALAHESLHSDADVDSKEEAICSAIEAVIHGQLLLESPELATAGTRMARYNNTRLLERLNGRDATGKLRVLTSTGFTLPRSQVGYGFAIEYYEPFTRNTPGSAGLAAMLQAVTGMAAPAAFDNPTIELLDAHQTALSAPQLVALAETLKLDTDPAADRPVPDRPAAPLTPPAPSSPDPAETEALRLLQQPPFAPANVALFDQLAYPGGPPDAFAAAPGPDAAAARRLLQQVLNARLGPDDARTAATLSAFDGAAWGRIAPEPSLRAAVLSLRGSFGDTVIGAFEAGVFEAIGFGAAAPDLPLAGPVPPAPGARPRLVVNGLIRHEDPRLLAPWIVEAALHDDAVKTPKELLVGRALVPLVHARQLLDTPDLVKAPTRLGRLLNRLLLGRINARDAQGKLRLLMGRGAIFPGSAGTQTTYLAIYVPYGPDTPGSRTLWDVVSALTGSSFDQGFSVATVGLLDTQQRLFSAQQIVALARLLELRVP